MVPHDDVVRHLDALTERVERLDAAMAERLDRLETTLAKVSASAASRPAKAWYTVDEAAAVLGKVPFTVREWCRLGRINARKKQNGFGNYKAWVISHAELERIQREGLLPVATTSTRI